MRVNLLLLVPTFLAASTVASASAHADVSVGLTLTPAAEDLANELDISLDDLEARAQAGITEALNLVDVKRYLRSFGDATSFAGRGLGADYASNSELFTLGVALGLGASADGITNDSKFSAGAAASFTILGGMNLAHWRHRELSFYGNFFHSSTDDGGALSGSLTSLGAHGQYKLFTPTRGLKRLLFQWGGVDLTSGLELSRWSVGIKGETEVAYTVEGRNGSTAALSAGVDGSFGLRSTTVVLPIEVTTNVRLLYILGLYAGVGVDVQVGSSSVEASLGGNISAEVDGDRTTIASVRAAADVSERPSIVQAHALLGLQLNLYKLKFFVQATLQPVSTVGFATGLRLAW